MDHTRSLVEQYIQKNGSELSAGAIGFCAGVDTVRQVSETTARSIVQELRDQRQNLKLIASENYSSLRVQMAQGNLLTDKYAEGIPSRRFYSGCDNVDAIESEAAHLAKKLFGAEHAYVQPHSGADANMVAYLAILSAKIQKPILDTLGIKNLANLSQEEWLRIKRAFLGQKLLALDYYSGGHLTHGYRYNFSGVLFDASTYSVDPSTHLLDLDELYKKVKEVRPTIFLAGYSAYSRKLNFAKMREMADEVGAVFMVDMSHFSGLVAGKVFQGEYDPVKYAHVITSTTHKTLRGPRGGVVLCTDEYAEFVDKGCPMVLGGPLPHVMAAKVVAFQEALMPAFQTYAHRIVENTREMADAFMKEGIEVLTGGSDNHMLLIDLTKLGLTGRQAETALRACACTLNRNALPNDPNGPWYTSGLRIGTPAITTLGMGKKEMREIAQVMSLVLKNATPYVYLEGAKKGQKNSTKVSVPQNIEDEARNRVKNLLSQFPLYPEINVDLDAFLANP